MSTLEESFGDTVDLGLSVFIVGSHQEGGVGVVIGTVNLYVSGLCGGADLFDDAGTGVRVDSRWVRSTV